MARRISLDLPPDVEIALAAFGTPARIAIIDVLRTDEPATKAHIADVLGMDSKTTIYHLAKLADLCVVVSDPPPGPERSGQHPRYSLDHRRVAELYEAMGRMLGGNPARAQRP